EEIEAELEELPEAGDEAGFEGAELPEPSEPDPAAGPILATKGKASAAPPTDPGALAYGDDGHAMPQAMADAFQTQAAAF
ncbi:MAG TPA: hypothetical protein DD795_12825, partial [Erythrobacter sp.]|nr:hypothetical protein [Erythrobacter sp.]